MCLFIATLFVALFCSIAEADDPHPLSDEFIDMINAEQSAWIAGRNFAPDTPYEYVKGLSRTILNDLTDVPRFRHSDDVIASLPESFDPRDKWPYCPSLDEIRDQSNCGSCWAFGAVEAMTDRFCIHSNGTKQFHFSAEDLSSCCKYNDGCHGGSIEKAWKWYVYYGIVSGGPYNSTQGCRSYSIPPCNPLVSSCSVTVNTPDCIQKCEESYNVDYENDKHYGKEYHSVEPDEKHIKAELYTKGPVEAGFEVYDDFNNYKSGVYIHTKGVKVGAHAVKIIGWGVENGHKHWLIANSWGTTWGDQGFFKMLRGENNCRIEEFIVAGEP